MRDFYQEPLFAFGEDALRRGTSIEGRCLPPMAAKALPGYTFLCFAVLEYGEFRGLTSSVRSAERRSFGARLACAPRPGTLPLDPTSFFVKKLVQKA